MDVSVTIERKEQYLRVIVSGENTLTNVLAYMDEIYKACLTQNVNHVLIEERLTGPNLDTFDVFEVVIKNFGRARTLGLRIAYVDLNADHSKRGLKFAENLAHIRGVNVAVFTDTETANPWLLQDLPGCAA
ncbi:MAG: hypothetical protein F9K22_08235 [Bacteroidetes bacterium]|nr:MAG: hypothetical protein F9K22_08235 [Bacteroidota bacterium]